MHDLLFLALSNERSAEHGHGCLKFIFRVIILELEGHLAWENRSAQIMEEYGKKPEGMVITPTDSTKEIAGYNCSHALVTFKNDPDRSFSVFYTNEIGVEAPNWCTPFHEVKGVLMEATINKFNIDMHMVAKEVVEEDYEDEEFQVTEEYQPITVEEMEDIFQSF
jgi:GLPGLI family protein